MQLLATSDDLRNYLGTDDIDFARADFILAAITSEVRAFARKSFEFEVNDIEELDGSGTNIVLLPGVPVTTVSSVVEGGVTLDPAAYEWNRDGILRRIGGNWVQKFRNIAVTYTHGHREVPEQVRLLIVRIAARGYVNPTAVTNEGMAGYTAGYGFDDSRQPMLTDSDRLVLRDLMGS